MPLMFDGVMNGPKKLSDADAAFEMIVKARPVFPVTQMTQMTAAVIDTLHSRF